MGYESPQPRFLIGNVEADRHMADQLGERNLGLLFYDDFQVRQLCGA